MADPVDPAAPQTISRTRRSGATKARPSAAPSPSSSPISTDTENKLARAARSAQRLAQLTDVPTDDPTLDLFPDDPTRATLQAMNIDLRQGTLSGFELPEVVLAALGADGERVDGHAAAAADAKPARRGARTAKAEDETVLRTDSAPDMWSDGAAGSSSAVDGNAPVQRPAVAAATAADAPSADAETDASGPSSMAAASVLRSVAALRQAAEAGGASPAAGAAASPVAASGGRTGPAPQRFAATFAKAASASASAAAVREPEAAADAPSAGKSDDDVRPGPVPAASAAEPPAFRRAPPQPVTQPSHDIARDTPELDRARATAFADTVDALYGVIADQRRAALDHSKRMKWMLSIVVGALLVTVAVGIAQTMLLMRLERNTTLQQQRIEQMMLSQQATLTTLLDTDSATVSAPAVTPPTPAPAAAAPAHPAAAPKHPAKAQHGHKAKSANTH